MMPLHTFVKRGEKLILNGSTIEVERSVRLSISGPLTPVTFPNGKTINADVTCYATNLRDLTIPCQRCGAVRGEKCYYAG